MRGVKGAMPLLCLVGYTASGRRRGGNRVVCILLFLGGVLALAMPADAAVKYKPQIEGIRDSKLVRILTGLSALFRLKDKPPDTIVGLEQRARADLATLAPAVQGAGYWEAKLDYSIDEKAKPARVTIVVQPGPLYRLAKVTLAAPGGGAPAPLANGAPETFGLKLGGPALTAPVVAAEPLIVDEYGHEGRPFAKVIERKVVIDRATKEMTVTYLVDAGPRVRFGPYTVEGLRRLDRTYVDNRIKWREGEVYDVRLVTQTRLALIASGLFASVRINHGPARADGENVPMTLTVVERARHSVGAGLYYDTQQGVGSRAYWEDRNVFGGGENLRVQGQVAQQLFDGLARFRKPDVLRPDQDFVGEAELSDERPDPYESRRLRVYSGLERHVDPRFDLGGGLQFETAKVTQNALFDDVPSHLMYSLFSTPVYARFDGSDDKLNPTRGHREDVSVTPYAHVAGTDVNFAVFRGKMTGYQALDADTRYVLAAYGALGVIAGEPTERLPADKRLYVGGGGSVRGFGYQRAGPLGSGNLPTGGISSLEFGTELRIKITNTIGIVPFFDAGSAYRTIVPHPGSELFYGAGIGGRYYTPIGPLRLDLAFPINKRSSDSFVQVYISVGQAF